MIETADKTRVAIVIQRYGLEVNGGAELHARLLAEQLKAHFEIDVLTSCAMDYQNWRNYYEPGITNINGIKVIRFRTESLRNRKRASSLFRLLNYQAPFQKIFKYLKLLKLAENQLSFLKPSFNDFVEWITLQGPNVPQLINYLKEEHSRYKTVIFFTYLYYPTVLGLKITSFKSIFIPTAHDEPAIHLPCFERIYNLPKCIIYNSTSERALVNKLFNNQHIDSAVAGIGIDMPDQIDFIDIKKDFNIPSDYLLYIGRIESGKGCKTLIDHFLLYLKKHKKPLTLVLIGRVMMNIPSHPGIISLGFVSENIKLNALKQAYSLVVPSPYESLSIVTLEAMKIGTPVLVNGQCEVLKNHVIHSNSGFIYDDYEGFSKSLDQIADKTILRKMAANGKDYVSENYNWERIISIFVQKINWISSEKTI
ncbi:MAG: glycosyltransferase family 4 protein [Sphingobacteriaceae bacterium]